MRQPERRMIPCLVFAILFALPLQAQQPPPEQRARADSTELVFEREVFSYPEFQRRSPFRPLSSISETGPDFGTLELLGVISSSEPGMSVALLGLTGSRTPTTAGGASTFRVRHGEVLGNARVIEIRRMSVIFEVEEFGMRERRTLQVAKPSDIPEGPGGVPDPMQVTVHEVEVPPGAAPIPGEGGSR